MVPPSLSSAEALPWQARTRCCTGASNWKHLGWLPQSQPAYLLVLDCSCLLNSIAWRTMNSVRLS